MSKPVRVKLDVFEGPLDLLLYLIKEEELDIYDIPITRITEQSLEYLNLMEMLDLGVAGEFLVMAAELMHIKSSMLLPPDPETPPEELDPRGELVRRLLEYKTFKEAADRLRQMGERRSGIFGRFGVQPELEGGGLPAGRQDSPFAEVSIFDLIKALSRVLMDMPRQDIHEVLKDEFTVADKVHEIFHRLVKEPVIYFSSLFRAAKNKLEVITTFLALLELIRLKEVLIAQHNHFDEIEIRRNVVAPRELNTDGEAKNQ